MGTCNLGKGEKKQTYISWYLIYVFWWHHLQSQQLVPHFQSEQKSKRVYWQWERTHLTFNWNLHRHNFLVWKLVCFQEVLLVKSVLFRIIHGRSSDNSFQGCVSSAGHANIWNLFTCKHTIHHIQYRELLKSVKSLLFFMSCSLQAH